MKDIKINNNLFIINDEQVTRESLIEDIQQLENFIVSLEDLDFINTSELDGKLKIAAIEFNEKQQNAQEFIDSERIYFMLKKEQLEKWL